MTWRDDLIPKRVQEFRDEVQRLDEAEKAQRRNCGEPVTPARRNLPEGPGERAARLRREEIERMHEDGNDALNQEADG